MSPITTHVLDTALGQPAAGLAVQLEMRGVRGRFKSLARGVTDANGRITDLLPTGRLKRGVYRLTFDTGAYFLQASLAAQPDSSPPVGVRGPSGGQARRSRGGGTGGRGAAPPRSKKLEGFYPSVSILFEVREPREHYHVPLLLSPFGYSTYRGS